MVALLPMPVLAEEGGEGEKINIPEIVLEHLADSYEWHIASYQGKHLSIPLPIIIRSEKKSIMGRSMSVWLMAVRFAPLI